MKWALIFIVVLLLSIFIGTFIFEYPGFVQIAWLGYEVQSSVVMLLLVLLFLVAVIFFFVRAIYWVFRLPHRWSSSWKHYREDKKDQLFLKFFTAVEAKEFQEALKLGNKNYTAFEKDPLFLWTCGRVFEEMNHHLEAEKCFLELAKDPATLFLGLKGQIRAALHRGDRKQAYDFLKRANEVAPDSPWVLKHLLALTRENGKFDEEEALILRLEDLGFITSEQSKKQIAQSQYEQAKSPNLTDTQKEAFLRQAHYLDASHIKATEALALLLSDQGEQTYARTIIEETWEEAPVQSLGDLYLKVDAPKDDLAAFEIAQKLTEKNPTHSESLLFLARKALDANLWGEARKYLQALMKKNPTADVYQLFARLELEGSKDQNAALKWLEEGLKAPRHV